MFTNKRGQQEYLHRDAMPEEITIKRAIPIPGDNSNLSTTLRLESTESNKKPGNISNMSSSHIASITSTLIKLDAPSN